MYIYKGKTYDYDYDLLGAIKTDIEDRRTYNKLHNNECESVIEKNESEIRQAVIDQMIDAGFIEYVKDEDDTEAQIYKEKIEKLKERDASNQ